MAAKLSRQAIARHVASQLAANNASVVIPQLAAFLVENKRTKELDAIVRDVHFYTASQGVVIGEVVSAFSLEKSVLEAITAYIQQKTGAKTVLIDSIVKPEVLGGVAIRIPGQEVNATIANQLRRLTTELKKA